MTREAEAIFEADIEHEDTVDLMIEDFSLIDAIELSERKSIFDD